MSTPERVVWEAPVVLGRRATSGPWICELLYRRASRPHFGGSPFQPSIGRQSPWQAVDRTQSGVACPREEA